MPRGDDTRRPPRPPRPGQGIGPVRQPRRPRGKRGLVDDRQAGLPAVPLPIPPSIFTFPSPDVPAANQPFPRTPTPAAVGGVLVGAAIGVIVFEVLRISLKRKQELDEARKKREREASGRRQAPDIPLPEVIFTERPPDPKFEFPEFELPPLPTAPGLPRAPVLTPRDIPLPQVGIPVPVPVFDPVPGPQTPTVPAPAPTPGPLPSPSPGIDPGTIPGFGVPGTLPLPGPTPFPVGFPSPFPASFPVPRVGFDPRLLPVGDFGLTPFNPLGVASGPRLGFVELPSQEPAAQAQQQECRNVSRARRKKGRCREGFFSERPDSTQFITWRDFDC